LDGQQEGNPNPILESSHDTRDDELLLEGTSRSNEPETVEQPVTNGVPRSEGHNSQIAEMQTRLNEHSKSRQLLQAEVTSLRKSLEEIQQKHEDELSALRSQLEEAQSGKEHAEIQYRNLLGKVNTIRSQLGERLKSDAVRMLIYFEPCSYCDCY
jgi:predicted  nucleic acid-binding Zn-ribbon protein